MAEYKKVITKSEIQPGKGKVITVDEKEIAVFNVNGAFYAIENTCLHQGGPLGDGDLSGSSVSCPWHGWEYDVTNGQCLDRSTVKVKSYPVKIEGEDILLDVG